MEPITLTFMVVLAVLSIVGGVVKWHNLSSAQQIQVAKAADKVSRRYRHKRKHKKHKRSKSCNDGNESDFVNQVIILPPEEKKKDKSRCDIL